MEERPKLLKGRVLDKMGSTRIEDWDKIRRGIGINAFLPSNWVMGILFWEVARLAWMVTSLNGIWAILTDGFFGSINMVTKFTSLTEEMDGMN